LRDIFEVGSDGLILGRICGAVSITTDLNQAWSDDRTWEACPRSDSQGS
jgi:hypothetical protein